MDPVQNRSLGKLPMSSSSPQILVIGGGLAGLAAASTLIQNGQEVLLLEASDDVGGRVRTDLVEGFQLDRGFQVLLTAYPELERHLDLDALDLRHFEPGAVVFRNGNPDRLADPFRRPTAVPAAVLSSSLTVRDKLLLLRLRHQLARMTATSHVHEADTPLEVNLHKIGFSRRAIDRFFNPLLSGIQLTVGLEGSSRLGFLVLRTLFADSAAVPAAGMGQLPHQMAAALPVGSIRTSCAVERREGRTIWTETGDVYRPGQIVVATDGPTAASLLEVPRPRSRPQSCSYFAAPKVPTDSRAILLDGDLDGPARNVAVMTNVAPGYSPDHRSLIATVMPGRYEPNCADLVLPQMRRWFGDEVDEWEHLRTYTIAHGQPGFEVGTPVRRQIRFGLDLFVCGDHRDTPSIQGALVSGRRTAEALLNGVPDA